MSTFNRSGHWRTNSYGTKYWVSEHRVSRDDWGIWGCENNSGSGARSSMYLISPFRYNSVDSFTNPNALCPVCGAPVFFYMSPYGGRVFFDELGPPWTKHPCTDNKALAPKNTSSNNNVSLSYTWQKDGWAPFFIKSLSRKDNEILQINGLVGIQNVVLNVKQPLRKKHSGDFEIKNSTIMHVKKIDEGHFLLSFVNNLNKAYTIHAFKLSFNASSFVGGIEIRNI